MTSDVASGRTRSIEALLDRAELAELTARWAHAVDRADVELIRSCYHPDGTDDHGSWQGSGAEFAEWIVGLMRQRGLYHHQLGSQLFEIVGDTAYGETYFTFHNLGDDGAVRYSWGRYIDRFERRTGQWRISERHVVSEWIGTLAATDVASMAPAGFLSSTKDRSDPFYAIRRGDLRP